MDNFEYTFNTICRICLSYGDGGKMVSLTDITEDDGLSSYGKTVLSLTSISVRTECLPDKMCAKCCSVLEQVIMFKRTCENSNEKLTKFMHNLDSLDTQTPDFKVKLCEYVLFIDSKDTEFPSKMSAQYRQFLTLNHEENIDDIENFIKKEHRSDELDDNIIIQNDSPYDVNEEINSIDEKQPDVKQKQDTISFRTHKRPKRKVAKKKKFKYEENSGMESDNNSIGKEYHPGDKLYTINKQQKETIDTGLGKKLKRKAAKYKKPNSENHSGTESDDKITKENCPHNDTESSDSCDEYHPNVKKKISNNLVQCKLCMKTLTELYLKIHMRRWHNADDKKHFICDHCGKKCFDSRDLQHHAAGVHGITPFVCKVCGYKARCGSRLKIHNRTHTGERPYECEKCGLTFIRPYALKKHSRLHMEKSIKCPYPKCMRKFHIREYMLSHFNGSHHRLYMFACNQCDVTYASNLTVTKHLTDEHGIPKKDHGRIKKIDLEIPPDIKNILGKK